MLSDFPHVTAKQTVAFTWRCPLCGKYELCRQYQLGNPVTCVWCRNTFFLAEVQYADGARLLYNSKETLPSQETCETEETETE